MALPETDFTINCTEVHRIFGLYIQLEVTVLLDTQETWQTLITTDATGVIGQWFPKVTRNHSEPASAPF